MDRGHRPCLHLPLTHGCRGTARLRHTPGPQDGSDNLVALLGRCGETGDAKAVMRHSWASRTRGACSPAPTASSLDRHARLQSQHGAVCGCLFRPSRGHGGASPTFAAILPYPEVHLGDVLAAAVAMWEFCHPEHVPLHTGDVVCIVAQDPGQRRLPDLRQLGRG